MTDGNRVLALQLAVSVVAPSGGGMPADKTGDGTAVATMFYRWLEGPVVLFVTVDPETFSQAAPEGPGTPTVRKGNTVQLTDIQQVTLTVAEQDSKGQPASDQLAWAVDNPAVVAITPSADTMSCLCVAGTDGTATVTVTDNSVNPPLTATDTITVVSSAATSLVIGEGTPENQPAPPAPPSGA
jgi:hypothetical protein